MQPLKPAAAKGMAAVHHWIGRRELGRTTNLRDGLQPLAQHLNERLLRLRAHLGMNWQQERYVFVRRARARTVGAVLMSRCELWLKRGKSAVQSRSSKPCAASAACLRPHQTSRHRKASMGQSASRSFFGKKYSLASPPCDVLRHVIRRRAWSLSNWRSPMVNFASSSMRSAHRKARRKAV